MELDESVQQRREELDWNNGWNGGQGQAYVSPAQDAALAALSERKGAEAEAARQGGLTDKQWEALAAAEAKNTTANDIARGRDDESISQIFDARHDVDGPDEGAAAPPQSARAGAVTEYATKLGRLRHVVGQWNPHSPKMAPLIEMYAGSQGGSGPATSGVIEKANAYFGMLDQRAPDFGAKLESGIEMLDKHLDQVDPVRIAQARSTGQQRSYTPPSLDAQRQADEGLEL